MAQQTSGRHWDITDEFLDHRTGMHVIVFQHKTVQEFRHLVQVMGKDPCPTCGHVRLLDNMDDMDAVRAQALEELDQIHEAELDRIRQHGIRAK